MIAAGKAVEAIAEDFDGAAVSRSNSKLGGMFGIGRKQSKTGGMSFKAVASSVRGVLSMVRRASVSKDGTRQKSKDQTGEGEEEDPNEALIGRKSSKDLYFPDHAGPFPSTTRMPKPLIVLHVVYNPESKKVEFKPSLEEVEKALVGNHRGRNNVEPSWKDHTVWRSGRKSLAFPFLVVACCIMDACCVMFYNMHPWYNRTCCTMDVAHHHYFRYSQDFSVQDHDPIPMTNYRWI